VSPRDRPEVIDTMVLGMDDEDYPGTRRIALDLHQSVVMAFDDENFTVALSVAEARRTASYLLEAAADVERCQAEDRLAES
jgi:hypothetical protein